MNFLLFSGSFHSKSRSLAILNALVQMLLERQITPQINALNELPFYDEDLNLNRPDGVKDFLADVEACDGIIFCTPEYNHGIPAVLKNALDWASRPAFQAPLTNKPTCIITQAVSPVGGARAQAQLKLVLDATLSPVLLNHEMMIPDVTKVIVNGVIANADVKRRLERYVDNFIKFAQQVKKSREL